MWSKFDNVTPALRTPWRAASAPSSFLFVNEKLTQILPSMN